MLAIVTRLRWLGALIGVSALAALLTLVVFSPAAQADHSWGNYHWANNKDSDGNGVPDEFVLKLGDNVSSAWDSHLTTTSSDWSKSSVLDTAIISPGAVAPKSCKPLSGRVDVCNERYGYNGWLGVAGISVSGSHITKAYVKLNDSYFSTRTYNTPAWRNLVMCQEVGHAFGLDHQDEVFDNANLGSCMDYTNAPSTNQHPNQHDYDQLEAIYDHLDSTTTISSLSATSPMAPAAIQGEDNTQRGWGRKIRDSGKLELWELDLGGGKKLFRFVIRA